MKYTNMPRHHNAENRQRPADPFDVRDQRNFFPASKMFEAQFGIVPDCGSVEPRELVAKVVKEPDLALAGEHRLHCGNDDGLVIVRGYRPQVNPGSSQSSLLHFARNCAVVVTPPHGKPVVCCNKACQLSVSQYSATKKAIRPVLRTIDHNDVSTLPIYPPHVLGQHVAGISGLPDRW